MGQMQKMADMIGNMPHSPEMIQLARNMANQMSNDEHRNMTANNTSENMDQLSSLNHISKGLSKVWFIQHFICGDEQCIELTPAREKPKERESYRFQFD